MQAPPPPDRLDSILDAAFAVFADYGFRRVTMEDIAARVGMSRSALYVHFHNKEDIFRSLTRRYLDACAAGFADALQTEGPDGDVLLAAFAAKDGRFMETVLGTPHGRELLDAGLSVACDIARDCENRMTGDLARWLQARGGDAALGGAQAVAEALMAALKGLKSAARSIEAYRSGQTVLARMMARALRE